MAGALALGCADAGVSGDDADPQVADQMIADQGALDAAPDSDVDLGRDPGPLDMGADAYIPVMPDEQPTDGPATLEGPADLTQPVPAGQARAGLVDDEAEALTGPDAQCRPGCFRLDNDLISVCIQGESTFSQLTFMGGNIIDAYPAGHGRDRLREISVAPSLGEVSVDEIGIVRDGSDGGPAIIRTTGKAGGGRTVQAYLTNGSLPGDMTVTTEYRLMPGARHVDVLSWHAAAAPQSIQVTDVIFFGDRVGTFSPEQAIGAAPSGEIAFIGAQDGDVAYAWRTPDDPLSVLNIPIDAFPLRPVILDRVTFQAGDVRLYRRQFWVGPDIESVRTPGPEAVPMLLTGPPNAVLDIDDGERQITRVHLGEDGMRTVRLVPDAYQATYRDWPGGARPEPQWFGAVEDEMIILDPPPAAAELTLTVTDQDDVGLGAKAVFSRPGDERIEFIMREGVVRLPAGDWSLTVTRGWHYSVYRADLTLEAGEARDIDVELLEEIPFDGLSAGEFHQHATLSLDSEVPLQRRVHANIAEGVGFMLPSEHDVLYDYGILAAKMGVLDQIAVPMTGLEISPLVGHLGAYGIVPDETQAANNAPPLVEKNGEFWRKRTVPELVSDARARGAEFMQINHPRDSTGYFDTVRLDLDEPIDTIESEHWTTDFDTVEVYNGQSDFCPVLSDWMGLLNQGVRLTAVGNSDSHGEGKAVGYPRNYVPTAGANPWDVLPEEVSVAMREGRSTIGGGAVMDFPDGPQPGDLFEAPNGEIELHVRLRTPSYLQIKRLIGFQNGRVVVDLPIDAAPEVITDFDARVPIAVDTDGPIVLLALGDERLGVIAGGPVFALSNPIWVDADGDGRVTPAGPGKIELPPMSICQ